MEQRVSLFVVILTAISITQSQPTIQQTDNNFCDYSSTLINEVCMLRAKLEAMGQITSINGPSIYTAVLLHFCIIVTLFAKVFQNILEGSNTA